MRKTKSGRLGTVTSVTAAIQLSIAQSAVFSNDADGTHLLNLY